MKSLLLTFLIAPLLIGCQDTHPIKAKIAQSPKTFCNPVNLNYRFMKIDGGEGIREAADPVVVSFKDKYYLFASKSSGYWYSEGFTDWKHVFITDSVLPIEDYAPGLFIHKDHLYYVGSTHGKGMLYRSAAPETGEWEPVKEIWSYWDPAFYVEGDNLYIYYGCSPVDPIYAQVLDLNTLEARTEVITCFNSNKEEYGWERTGEHNELPRRPYIEGAWMTAHQGKYYLQYAAPGTEWKSYADGTYVSDSPSGPFTYMENSPVSYKPTGFIGGAGHGCMFTVGSENYWKAATNSISVRHMFERRVSFYPAGFDKDGYLYTDTYLGDYPMFLPTEKRQASDSFQPGWMLLSYGKTVTASSTLDGFPAENIVDEDSRTAWVAATNNDTEWLQVDLQHLSSVNAIQVNFDEYGAKQKGFVPGVYQSYVIYASVNGEDWYPVVDYSTKKTDTPHDYIEFEEPFKARYIKLQNKEYTVSSNLSVRDLRIFGNGLGSKPRPVNGFTVKRNEEDPCIVSLAWNEVPHAQGYIVRYGIAEDKLYSNFQVMGETSLEIGSLNKGVTYYFTIDTYNENGITRTEQVEVCR
ncbi:discoidin domain-containing protein [Parabacteroides goldsteinii]|uniref:discoidin domain-containing protein n=2 Tax=Parabacteroides goldsteinii TaxID=328812 RepID=UPI0024954194|nr:discoidin domain-containing protein [Parabacteroides goldsteinii]